MAADRDGARRLLVDGEAVTPLNLQVRAVLAVHDDSVLFQANDRDEATLLDVWRWSDGELIRINDGEGVHAAVVGGPTTVISSTSLDRCGVRTEIVSGPVLTSFAETPLIDPNVSLHWYGDRRLATAVLLPHDHDGSALPVLVDSYGGAARAAHEATTT